MLARMGLTFWRAEEEWCMDWLTRDGFDYISNRFSRKELEKSFTFDNMEQQLISLLQEMQPMDPLKLDPAKRAIIPTTRIILKEPAERPTATNEASTAEPSVPSTAERLDPPLQLSPQLPLQRGPNLISTNTSGAS